MADKFVEIEVHGEERIIASLEAQQHSERAKLRRLIDELADFGEHYLYGSVPRGKSKYIFEHVAREGPHWMPGGAGGGGQWKAIVGIKEGTSRHPLYVEFGTGLYAGNGYILPVNARVMRIEKMFAEVDPGGKTTLYKYRYWVSGQPPQYYFRSAWRVLNAYARIRVFGEALF